MNRRFTLRSGPQEVEIVPREDLLDFSSADATLSYLRQFLADPQNRAELRKSLAEGGLQVGQHLFSDEELLVVLAHRVVSGELRILRRRLDQPKPSQEATAQTTPREVEASQPKTAAASSPPPPPAEEEASDLDQVAQAMTLESAAESGAPVCEAWTHSTSSGPEDSTLEEVDLPAQAVVFQSASRTGQPLCDTWTHSESSGSEDDELLADVNLGAQALVLQEAAVSGAPLCDTWTHSTPSGPESDEALAGIDQAAQAAAFQEAAEAGSPLCDTWHSA